MLSILSLITLFLEMTKTIVLSSRHIGRLSVHLCDFLLSFYTFCFSVYDVMIYDFLDDIERPYI